MSVITFPARLPVSFQLTLSTSQRVSASPFGGSEQAVDLLNDRWMASMDFDQQDYATAATIEAFINAMRGQTNTVALYHFARPVPRGTLRGSLTLNAAAAQGASSIVITGGAPSTGTLLQGDMLGVGGLLLQVQNDCVAVAGVITVPIINRLRTALSSGAVVTWNMPTANFRLLNKAAVPYGQALSGTVSLDFGEKI